MNEFDDRYRLPPRRVTNPGLRKRAGAIRARQVQEAANISHRPPCIGWFEEVLQGAHFPDDRAPVGFYCAMLPVEMIEAMEAVPVRLDGGNSALSQAGEEMLTGEICPLAKSSYAGLLDEESLPSRCRAFVLPASCDAKRKMGEVLADYAPTFTVNLPAELDADRYLRPVAEELERLNRFLAETLGTPAKRRRLLAAIQRGRQRARLVRELAYARAKQPAAMSIRDFFSVVQAYTAGCDPDEWFTQAAAVLDWVRAFQPTRQRMRPRLVLTGAPLVWPNYKLLNLLEECGADVVADTVCTGAESCYDPVVLDERGWKSLYRALALRYVFASPCPCFVSQGRRLTRVLDFVERFTADAVVNHGLRLCQLFDIETYRLSSTLKERKIPFMNARTDYSLEDTEQLRVRLEAFLETLEE